MNIEMAVEDPIIKITCDSDDVINCEERLFDHLFGNCKCPLIILENPENSNLRELAPRSDMENVVFRNLYKFLCGETDKTVETTIELTKEQEDELVDKIAEKVVLQQIQTKLDAGGVVGVVPEDVKIVSLEDLKQDPISEEVK